MAKVILRAVHASLAFKPLRLLVAVEKVLRVRAALGHLHLAIEGTLHPGTANAGHELRASARRLHALVELSAARSWARPTPE